MGTVSIDTLRLELSTSAETFCGTTSTNRLNGLGLQTDFLVVGAIVVWI